MKKLLLIICIIFILVGCSNSSIPKSVLNENTVSADSSTKPYDLFVHFINVGQGDSVLIHTSNTNILIDAGDNKSGKTVIDYLKKNNISNLNAIIATHPDEDHIGGMDDVLNNFKVETIIDSGIVSSTNTYKDYWAAVQKQIKNGTKLVYKGYIEYGINKNITLNIIDSGDPKKDSDNNNSIVARLTYNNISYLFTGDIEKSMEGKLISYHIPLRADILKVSHHGANSASSIEFLKAVNPKVAVISVGSNRYGHPTKEVLDSLKKIGAKILRTDEKGNIIISTNGESYKIN